MPVPGLGIPILSEGLSYGFAASATVVDPWTLVGSPAQAITANVYVGEGIVIGSTSAANPAMRIRHYHGSTVNIFVSGKIGAAGGTGGGGDRGRNNGTQSAFVGGGGGGGAGTNPGAGGLRAVEADPDADPATDGDAGTTTTGGLGGTNAFVNVGNGGYTAGSRTNLLARNPAILIWPADGHTITVNIWNGGEIFAGGDGGLGGFQDGSLPGGANDPEDGEDLPAYLDLAPGALTDHPVIGYRFGQVTLNLMEGAVYPLMRGRVIAFSAVP